MPSLIKDLVTELVAASFASAVFIDLKNGANGNAGTSLAAGVAKDTLDDEPTKLKYCIGAGAIAGNITANGACFFPQRGNITLTAELTLADILGKTDTGGISNCEIVMSGASQIKLNASSGRVIIEGCLIRGTTSLTHLISGVAGDTVLLLKDSLVVGEGSAGTIILTDSFTAGRIEMVNSAVISTTPKTKEAIDVGDSIVDSFADPSSFITGKFKGTGSAKLISPVSEMYLRQAGQMAWNQKIVNNTTSKLELFGDFNTDLEDSKIQEWPLKNKAGSNINLGSGQPADQGDPTL